jgi:predicted AlkP superfamily pyrophosphatase or phosphodiesterase
MVVRPGLRRLLRLLALSVLLLSAAGASAEPDPVVIVLSWDGVRHDYPGRAELPGLGRMAREGMRAERLIPVFPASTFPNHVSLATGVPVDVHGIVANTFLDRERGRFSYENDASWIESEPLWVSAERQGVRAAVFFWVGSETDWRGTGATHRVAPFDSSVGEKEKVDRILAWLDLPESQRPQLVMSWWHGTDFWGHEKGPDSERTFAQLRSQDAELERLLKELDARHAWGHTTLLVISDHGMVSVSEMLDPEEILESAGIRARVVNAGALAHVFLDDPGEKAAALQQLRTVEGVRVYPGESLPQRLRYRHPRRVGDLVALTAPPRVFGDPWSVRGIIFRAVALAGGQRGAHGYDPAEHPEMAGIFLALGRGVPRGARIGPVSALDLAPTAARLLGIDPPPRCEGEAIATIQP